MRLAGIAGVFVAWAAPAAAAEVVCAKVAPGTVVVDGLLDDWSGPETIRTGPDPRDAAFSVRCAYDDQTLYLAVNVTDDRLIRSVKPRPVDDHLVLGLGAGRWEIYPGSVEAHAKLAVVGPKGLTVVDSLQKRGWSIELSAPRGKLAGVHRGGPSVPFRLALHDADVAAAPKIETVVDFGEGSLVLEEADALLNEFLTTVKLHRRDIALDVTADVDGVPGAERVVWGGRFIGILGQGFAYIELPAATARDVLEVRVVDLAGDGKSNLLARYVERGNGGSREVLAVWNVKNQTIARIFAHEVGKTLGRVRLTNLWELAPKKGKRRGHDLLIRAGAAAGATAESWNETPAEDMMPILLPWGEKTKELWHFDNDEVSGG
jgi:hypothetical protein